MYKLFVLAFLLLLGVVGRCASLKIAAFNVEIFGVTKFSRTDVVATLKQVWRKERVLNRENLTTVVLL